MQVFFREVEPVKSYAQSRCEK
eukprot:COSAG06_NODE_35849_length_454_cov_41.442254_1_plen_21_part_01